MVFFLRLAAAPVATSTSKTPILFSFCNTASPAFPSTTDLADGFPGGEVRRSKQVKEASSAETKRWRTKLNAARSTDDAEHTSLVVALWEF
ncbi:unnamed protein product [Urochloa humidicola]